MVNQENQEQVEFEENQEQQGVREREDLQDLLAALERRGTPERTDLGVLMGLQDLLVPKDREALWVSLEPEERGACWDSRVLLVHPAKTEPLAPRGALDLQEEWVYQEPRGQEEMQDLRVFLEQRGLLGKTDS